MPVLVIEFRRLRSAKWRIEISNYKKKTSKFIFFTGKRKSDGGTSGEISWFEHFCAYFRMRRYRTKTLNTETVFKTNENRCIAYQIHMLIEQISNQHEHFSLAHDSSLPFTLRKILKKQIVLQYTPCIRLADQIVRENPFFCEWNLKNKQ